MGIMRRGKGRRLVLELLEPRLMLDAGWQNPVNRLDVNADRFVSPIDVLQIINYLNVHGSQSLPVRAGSQASPPFVDTTGDGHASPADALLPINALNRDDDAPQLIASLANDTAQDGTFNQDAMTDDSTLVGQAIDELTGIARVQIQVDDRPAVDVLTDTFGNFLFRPGLANDGSSDGSHRIRMSAFDGVSNRSAELLLDFELDTLGPTLVIDRPANDGLSGERIRLSGSATDGSGVAVARYALDGGSFSPISLDASGRFDQIIETQYVSGEHYLTVESIDAAGNATHEYVHFYAGDAITWDGGGGNNNWNTAANWQGDTIPLPTQTVIFDTTSSKNVVIDSNVTVQSFFVEPGYQGSIDFLRNTVTVHGDFEREGGSLSAATSTIIFDGFNVDQTADFGANVSLGNIAVFKNGGVMTFAKHGFNAFRLGVSSGDEVKFQAGQLFTLHDFLVDGRTDRIVKLDSTSDTQSWRLNVAADGQQDLAFADVRLSDARGGAPINATDNVADLGGNQNWNFTTAVRFTLSTDENKSVIQMNGILTLAEIPDQGIGTLLTLNVYGTTQPTVVDIQQRLEAGGRSNLFMGGTGTNTSARLTTSGGANNTATLMLRGDKSGAFQNDITIRALVDGVDRFGKFATVVELRMDPLCVCLNDQRLVTQTVTVFPPVPGMRLEGISFVRSGAKVSPTEILKAPDYPPINEQGTAQRIFRASVQGYTIHSTVAVGSVAAPVRNVTSPAPAAAGEAEDGNGPTPTAALYDWNYDDEPTCCASGCCPNFDIGNECYPEYHGGCGGSVFTSDGEKKLDLVDLTIKSRGFDYKFQRIYRSADYAQSQALDDFGENWTYSYASDRMVKDGDRPDLTATYLYYTMEQQNVQFVNIAPGEWVPGPEQYFSHMTLNPHTGDLELRQEDGFVRTFFAPSDPNRGGRLKEIRDRNDNRMTFHYERIDPDISVDGDEMFVLAFVIDTLGREIRYRYYARTSQIVSGRQVAIAHPSGNRATWGRLESVRDFKGDMNFDGLATSQDFAGQVNNRLLTFDYDDESNLVRVSQPAIDGTPTGNDFEDFKTFRYKYLTKSSLPAGLTETQRDFMLHRLTHIWAPNEVRNAFGVNPPESQAVQIVGYELDPSDPFFGYAISHTVGGVNGSGVPSGGTVTYEYTDLNPFHRMPFGVVDDFTKAHSRPALQVLKTDRNGNQSVWIYSCGKTLLEHRELTRDFRPVEPAGPSIALDEHGESSGDSDPVEPESFDIKYTQNHDRKLVTGTMAEGNSFQNVYNSSSTDRFQQGNLIRSIRRPDPERGGDQRKIEEVAVFEPIYNQSHLIVDPRGTDVGNNDFAEPIPDPLNRIIPDPYDPAKRIDLRYSRIIFFDYQESTERASAAPNARLDIDGSEGLVNESPLIAVDPNVLTTEVLLIQELVLPENEHGLNELRKRLADNLVRLGLGDLNADGDTTPRIAGDWIRIVYGSPVLFDGSNQHLTEASVEAAGDLIASALGFFAGGPGETAAADRLQTIIAMYQYNEFGQITADISPEGNVTRYEYFAEIDADGDANPAPLPADGRTLNATTGGYLQTLRIDAQRDYFLANGSRADPRFSNNGQNPVATEIKISFTYDDVGNETSITDGRGIRTDNFVNEHDQIVQTTRAADVSAAAAAQPTDPLVGSSIGALTAFAYQERVFYDFNGNDVLSQTEDRGNTSSTDGSGLGVLPAHVVNTTPGLTNEMGQQVFDVVGDGRAFADQLTHYDIQDFSVESRVEVFAPLAPQGKGSDMVGQSLDTRFRYDPNMNLVLTIYPEGNATTSIYDERDLPLRTTRGALTPPELDPSSPAATSPTNLAPSDPVNYDVRGGVTCQCTTYHYDLNGNVIESVDSDDTDSSPDNNSRRGGPGDRTRYVYDGYDRLASIIDSVGNQTVQQYDPAGNVVRKLRFGRTGGLSPTANGPDILAGPVSSLGVVQSQNLVNSNLMEATETVFDSLNRLLQIDRVLFVNTIPTARPPDVADGASDLGKGNLTPGDLQAILGIPGVTIIGRVSTRNEYDRNLRRTYMVEDDADAMQTFYDGVDRAIKSIDPEGNILEIAYDDNTNVIEIREEDKAQGSLVPSEVFITTYFYDSLDRVQRSVNNLGLTTENRYDSRDNLVVMADASGPAGPAIARRAFSGGPLTINTTNRFGNVTRYFYDGINRKTRQEAFLTASGLGDGSHIGASVEGVKNDPAAPESFPPAADPGQAGGDGIIRTGHNYDRNSLVSSLVDDQGNVTVYLYDNLNRRVSETKGLSVATTPLDKTKILGPRDVVTPTAATMNSPAVIPPGQIDSQLAAAKARLDAVAPLFPPLADRIDDHPPTTIVYGYDPDDNVLILEDENDSETFTKYDATNRRIAKRVFRSEGNPATRPPDSFAGDSIFAPAPVADPKNPSSPFPAVVGTNKHDYQYDGLLRFVRATDNNEPARLDDDSLITFAYDSLSRAIEETQQIGSLPARSISTAWRAENLRSRLTYPNDRAEVYTYDQNDRIDTVADAGAVQPIADYDYIGTYRVLVRAYPQNGTRMTYLDNAGTTDSGYDGLRRPIQLRNLRTDNSLIVGFTHTYDRTHNKLTEGKLHDPKNGESYSYDSAYRLIDFERPNAGSIDPLHSDWSLDGVGNWQSLDSTEFGPAVTETREHSSFNEIIQRSDGDTTSILSDDDGNQIDNGEFLFTWDSRNRLRSVTRKSDGMLVATYSYDAAGRRIRKVVTNSGALDGTTDFYLDGLREIEEHNAADAVTQQYVYGIYIDEPLVLDRNLDADTTATGPADQRLFYHQNTLYSVFALTDNSAKIIEAYQYDAYGRQTVFSPGPNGIIDFGLDDVVVPDGISLVGNPFLFTARRLDQETNLNYYRARFYDAHQGRFISRWSDVQNDLNLYQYQFGRPTYFTDPYGDPIWFIPVAIVAVLIVVVATPPVIAPSPSDVESGLAASLNSQLTAEANSQAASMLPGIGTGKAVAELITGVDVMTGQEIPRWQSAINVGVSLLPFAPRVFRGAFRGRINLDILRETARRFAGPGKCGPCATALSRQLDSSKTPYKWLVAIGEDMVAQDGTKVGAAFHHAIQVGDTVFDNFWPNGIAKSKWLDWLVRKGKAANGPIKLDEVPVCP